MSRRPCRSPVNKILEPLKSLRGARPEQRLKIKVWLNRNQADCACPPLPAASGAPPAYAYDAVRHWRAGGRRVSSLRAVSEIFESELN